MRSPANSADGGAEDRQVFVARPVDDEGESLSFCSMSGQYRQPRLFRTTAALDKLSTHQSCRSPCNHVVHVDVPLNCWQLERSGSNLTYPPCPQERCYRDSCPRLMTRSSQDGQAAPRQWLASKENAGLAPGGSANLWHPAKALRVSLTSSCA